MIGQAAAIDPYPFHLAVTPSIMTESKQTLRAWTMRDHRGSQT
jgi:hypothetical protein